MTQFEISRRCYERKKNNGLCVRCGKKLDRKGHYCKECLKKTNEENRKTKEFYRNLGICPICRKEKLYGDERQCIDCRQKHYEYNQNNPPTDEQKKKYAEHFKIQQKILYKTRAESGICTRCGKFKAKEGKRKCPICLEKDAFVHRQRYQSKTDVKEIK